MVAGFKDAEDFAPVIGWELYQITLDKYHVMFLFENGWQLLNVAHCFSHRSRDRTVEYTYETGGADNTNRLDRLLRTRITKVFVQSERELVLVFENGDELIVYDHPRFCSWWFMPVADSAYPEKALAWGKWDDLGEED
jgi:hypothetical protein